MGFYLFVIATVWIVNGLIIGDGDTSLIISQIYFVGAIIIGEIKK